jgi:amino acid transporter
MGTLACLPTVHSVSFAGLLTIIETGGLLLIAAAGLGSEPKVMTRLPELFIHMDALAVWNGLLGTTLIAVFAFVGFEHLVNVAEELKEPRRTLPRALFVTLGLTAVMYALVVWIAVVVVPPAELAASPAPLTLVFERLTGLPPATMTLIAIIATLNGIIVHMIMIGRVLYGMARQGNLPAALAALHPATKTPFRATVLGIIAILALASLAPVAGLADFTARFTLVIFVIVNASLLRIKRCSEPPAGIAFLCPYWVPVIGLASSLGLIIADVAVALGLVVL